MSSSGSSGVTTGFKSRGGGKGIPRLCRCGEGSVIKTSETLKNPGRLFYCCSYGYQEDRRHLFKWTDVAMVEEMDEVESVVEKIQVDVANLEKVIGNAESEMLNLAVETRTCEAVVNSYEEKIEAIKALAKGCEKEIGELKAMVFCNEKEIEGLRCFKNMVVCGLVMLGLYYFILP